MARASSAAISGVDMIDGDDDGPHPGRLDLRGQVGVDGVDHERVGDRGVEPGDADDGRFVAELDEHPVGRSLERHAADDR